MKPRRICTAFFVLLLTISLLAACGTDTPGDSGSSTGKENAEEAFYGLSYAREDPSLVGGPLCCLTFYSDHTFDYSPKPYLSVSPCIQGRWSLDGDTLLLEEYDHLQGKQSLLRFRIEGDDLIFLAEPSKQVSNVAPLADGERLFPHRYNADVLTSWIGGTSYTPGGHPSDFLCLTFLTDGSFCYSSRDFRAVHGAWSVEENTLILKQYPQADGTALTHRFRVESAGRLVFLAEGSDPFPYYFSVYVGQPFRSCSVPDLTDSFDLTAALGDKTYALDGRSSIDPPSIHLSSDGTFVYTYRSVLDSQSPVQGVWSQSGGILLLEETAAESADAKTILRFRVDGEALVYLSAGSAQSPIDTSAIIGARPLANGDRLLPTT